MDFKYLFTKLSQKSLKMDCDVVEKSLQAVIDTTIPMSAAQKVRIRQVCEGVLLAGSSQLSWIARWLGQTSTKDSRIKWLARLLEADYVCQESIDVPFVKHLLQAYAPPCLQIESCGRNMRRIC